MVRSIPSHVRRRLLPTAPGGRGDPARACPYRRGERDLRTAQDDAVHIACAEGVERFASDVVRVAAGTAFHDRVDRGIEPDAECAVDRLAAYVHRRQAVRAHQRVAEAQYAHAAPRAPRNLVQSNVDHAQKFTAGRLLELRVEQVHEVRRDHDEIRQGAESSGGVEKLRVSAERRAGLGRSVGTNRQ